MGARPTIIVTAAGAGRRFGSPGPKLLQPLDGASTVVGATVASARATGLPVVAVASAEVAAELAARLPGGDVVALDAAAASRGLGHSIAAGVLERPDATGWLVWPADMPRVRPATLLTLAAALQSHAVVCAQRHGRRGWPVGFAPELYSELILLDSDDSALRILARYPSHGVEVDDDGVLHDVDTVADLERLHAVPPPGAAAAAQTIATAPLLKTGL